MIVKSRKHRYIYEVNDTDKVYQKEDLLRIRLVMMNMMQIAFLERTTNLNETLYCPMMEFIQLILHLIIPIKGNTNILITLNAHPGHVGTSHLLKFLYFKLLQNLFPWNIFSDQHLYIDHLQHN